MFPNVFVKSISILLFVFVGTFGFPLQIHAHVIPFDTLIRSEKDGDYIRLQYCQNDECLPLGPEEGMTSKRWTHLRHFCTRLGLVGYPMDEVFRSLIASSGFLLSTRWGFVTLALAAVLPRTSYEQINTMVVVFPGLLSEHEFRLPVAQFTQIEQGFQHCFEIYRKTFSIETSQEPDTPAKDESSAPITSAPINCEFGCS